MTCVFRHGAFAIFTPMMALAGGVPSNANAQDDGPVVARGFETGDRNTIEISSESASEGKNGSRSSSRSRSGLVETVIEASEDVVVFEYVLNAEDEERGRTYNWQFPARVAMALDGTLTLLNLGEVAARNLAWRDAAGFPEEACGTYYFTWNAFKVECDPQSVVSMIASLGLHRLPTAGDAVILSSAPLQYQLAASGSMLARYQLSERKLREAEASAEVAAAGILGETVTFDETMSSLMVTTYAGEGSIEVVFDADQTIIRVERKERSVRIDPEDGREDRTATSVVSRRPAD